MWIIQPNKIAFKESDFFEVRVVSLGGALGVPHQRCPGGDFGEGGLCVLWLVASALEEIPETLLKPCIPSNWKIWRG